MIQQWPFYISSSNLLDYLQIFTRNGPPEQMKTGQLVLKKPSQWSCAHKLKFLGRSPISVITSQVVGLLTLHFPARGFYSLSWLLEDVKVFSGRSYDHEGVGLKETCVVS